PASDSFIHYYQRHGLTSNIIAAIQQSNSGEIYIASSNGLNILNPLTGAIRVINERSGMPIREFTSATARMPNGDLLFSGYGKLVRVGNEIKPRQIETAPQTLITHISIMNSEIESEYPAHRMKTISLPYDQNWLGFTFSLTDYSSPFSNRFRYRLEDFDRDWNYPGQRHFANYSNLPPGEYSFVVQGSSHHSDWNGIPARIRIQIIPPWWATIWFRITGSLLIIALIYLVILLRTRRLQHHSKALEQRVAERTAELQLELKERARAEEELREANQKVLSANKAKSQFLANMSHEIRTPMNGVLGMTELLLNTELDKEQRRFAEASRSSSNALLTLINDILDFSRIEAGQLVLESLEFNLADVLDQAAEILAYQAASKSLDYVVAVEPSIPMDLKGDAARLQQILINIIGNAIKFTEKGEVVVSVSTAHEDADSVTIRCSVRDSGIGIAPEKIDSLFLPFVQNDGSTTRKYGGSGLGLSISRQLVEMMHGSIQVSSELGLGSDFSFTVRFLRQSSQTTHKRKLELAGQKILLADESTPSRRALLAHMSWWGCDTSETHCTDGAISLLEESPDYDAIIFSGELYTKELHQKLIKYIGANKHKEQSKIIILQQLGRTYAQYSPGLSTKPNIISKPVQIHRIFDFLAGKGNESLPGNTRTTENEEYKSNWRILIAEDSPINQDIIYTVLSKAGYK
ncbi:MAG: hypothetical protein D6B26_02170, partial [Spirochaetaceae bacterium]